LHFLISTFLLWSAFALLIPPAKANPPDTPVLDWQPRSDWINVKTVTPAAAGDGKADDTVAIQAALDRGSNGKTIYLPPGTYRITQTLVFRGEGTGSAVIGHGRATRLVWDGPVGGRMFWSDGIAYSRYVGLSWDGQNRAAVGFDHAAKKRFETEILHEHEAFRNFTECGIRIGHEQKMASAEILYQNCLFENCGTGLALLTFNDYDHTIDRCEFRNCGTGVRSHKSNFYARNSHFEKSREADFVVAAEHGCSIRRCTSLGSKQFVNEPGTIAPLTIQDCQVADWTDTGAAVVLNGSPVLIFDCVFTPSSSKRPPVRCRSSSQKLILSGNGPGAVTDLVQGGKTENILVVPRGKHGGVVTNASQTFLSATVSVGGRVFDAVRDFGAKGDGKTDDTAAIQSAIDAARQHGKGAIAYLPTGRYAVTRTLTVTGSNYHLEGSGFNCGLIWRGTNSVPIIHVFNVVDVTVASLAVGHHDFGPMIHGEDILVQSTSNSPFYLTLDEVYAFGVYQKSSDKHGIRFDQLGSNCVVVAGHVQGNLKIDNCGAARLLFRTSYEGSVTLFGTNSARSGLTGFLTRLSTLSEPALRVADNQSAVFSEFYIEQAGHVFSVEGNPNLPLGHLTIQSPKIHSYINAPILESRGYGGRIYLGQCQFYQKPEKAVFQSVHGVPLHLLLAGNFWYGIRPEIGVRDAAFVTLAGNLGAADTPRSAVDLEALAAALDDLRALGHMDSAHLEPCYR
jgi:hypothetical protein